MPRIGYWLGHGSLEAGGTAPYSFRILDTLLRQADAGWEFVVLHAMDADAVRARLPRTAARVEVHAIPAPPTGLRRRALQLRKLASLATSRELPSYLEGFLRELRLDLLHVPLPVPPLAKSSTPYVVTVHDLQELHFPEYFTPEERALRAHWHQLVIPEATRIVVSFDHVKADVLRYFGVAPEKVHVCPIPIESVQRAGPTAEEAEEYARRHAEWSPFLLYPAQTWKHKNHLRLLRALRRVREEHGVPVRLVCTGRQTEYYGELEREIARLGLGDVVRFTGIVPESELGWLYDNARLVVIPTEYEAGSFPLMEAMMHEVPVVCSNVTSLPSTIGDARFTFPPDDVETMAACIARLCTDEGLRAENVENSRRRTGEMAERSDASEFFALYREVLREGGRG